MNLNKHLQKLIKQKGYITVAEFMNEVLTHYYHANEPFGKDGDFITAPEISQIFGELIGIWCATVWQQMGCPKCALVELGPGRGTLMKDLLRGTAHVPGFHESISVHMVETSQRLQDVQRETLEYAHKEIYWHKDLNAAPELPLLVVANEFFDALPINQYEKTSDGWSERIVKMNDNGFYFALSPVVKLPEESGKRHDNAPVGSVIEVSTLSTAITKYIAARIGAYGGAAVITDYGYNSYEYKSTLQAVKNHKYHDVLKDVGNADITAHVDFAALVRACEGYKIHTDKAMNQGKFLLDLGIEIRRDILMQKATKEQQELLASGVERLVSPSQMGDLFKVMLITGKGIKAWEN